MHPTFPPVIPAKAGMTTVALNAIAPCEPKRKRRQRPCLHAICDTGPRRASRTRATVFAGSHRCRRSDAKIRQRLSGAGRTCLSHQAHARTKSHAASGKSLAQLIYSNEAFADFERIIEFPRDASPASVEEVVASIQSAILILADHSLIGCKRDAFRRELIISYGHSGYVAMYRHDAAYDVVRILRVKHQRAAGFVD